MKDHVVTGWIALVVLAGSCCLESGELPAAFRDASYVVVGPDSVTQSGADATIEVDDDEHAVLRVEYDTPSGRAVVEYDLEAMD